MAYLDKAQAGKNESGDILITVTSGEKGAVNRIELQSTVLKPYGDSIRRVIACTLIHAVANGLHVRAIDNGALDFTIKARVLSALAQARILFKGGER